MFIILGFYRRRPDLTYEQFSRYWRETHGPLMRSIAEANPYLVRYVQHHLRPDDGYLAPPGTPADGAGYDGFSEAWFTDSDARDKWFNLPVFKIEGIDDERQFLDMSATRWVVRDEQHVILAGPEA